MKDKRTGGCSHLIGQLQQCYFTSLIVQDDGKASLAEILVVIQSPYFQGLRQPWITGTVDPFFDPRSGWSTCSLYMFVTYLYPMCSLYLHSIRECDIT